MTTLLVAMDNELLVARGANRRWEVERRLEGRQPQCLAVDPGAPERVYCGTFEHGLWRSEDGGDAWLPAGEGITHGIVMSVAVSPLERGRAGGVVWAGTEPSAIFSSEDGGRSWREHPRLRELPSAPTWKFPPRPWTNHVRWIVPDPVEAGRVFASIELGGVMRSLDGGETWEDRRPTGPLDAHTVRAHAGAPDRLYAAAGDGFMAPGNGYAESRDGGETWRRPAEGLRHDYLFGLAVDPGDPETVLVSGAHSPSQAHNPAAAASAIYRRNGSGQWEQCRAGLPADAGTLVSSLAANPAEPGVFYAANNLGVYRSADAGRTWERLALGWPEPYRRQRPNALVAVG